ncbi:trimethylamine methyltransferase family protein [bacterium]|nr:trimethylamine methyltransferase family protein [bacterium]
MNKSTHKKGDRPWPYQPLTPGEIQKIHQTTMKVLEEVGFEVRQPEAFEMFKKAGATVDHESRKVRVKESLVKKLISSIPSQVTLYGRDSKHDLYLGSGNVYFTTGGTALNVLDYETQKRRPANLQDLIEVIRIVDQMENIHGMLLPTYPNELAGEAVDINRFFAGLNFTSKHVMGGIYTQEGINEVIQMAEKVAGSPEALRERPIISMITCGISPLRLDSKYGSFMIDLARKSIPTAVPVEPLSGATAPASLAGTLVVQNCDGLINIMLSQLANPGAPVIYGSVATSVDFRDVSYLGGSVESGMLNAAIAQLARHYGFPYYSTAGISDSKSLDTQCGYESAISNLMVALAGGDFIHDAAGLMEFALTVSKEKLVIDDEILGMVYRTVKGFEVNEDTLAFETIKNVGPGGNFIADRHTRKYMYKDHYFPQLSNRENREDWTQHGSKTTAELAHEKVKEILSSEPVFYMDQKLADGLMKSFPKIKKENFVREKKSKK